MYGAVRACGVLRPRGRSMPVVARGCLAGILAATDRRGDAPTSSPRRRSFNRRRGRCRVRRVYSLASRGSEGHFERTLGRDVLRPASIRTSSTATECDSYGRSGIHLRHELTRFPRTENRRNCSVCDAAATAFVADFWHRLWHRATSGAISVFGPMRCRLARCRRAYPKRGSSL